MRWKTIRLELARTPDFPGGSVSRAYLLRLPIDEAGRIDEAAMEASPKQATVRRFWANEPDRSGAVRRDNGGWSLDCGAAGGAYFGAQPLLENREITLVGQDGKVLPFRVASIRPAR